MQIHFAHKLSCGDMQLTRAYAVTPGTYSNRNNKMLCSNPYHNFNPRLIITLFQTPNPRLAPSQNNDKTF